MSREARFSGLAVGLSGMERPGAEGVRETADVFDREWRGRFDRFGRTHTAEHAVSGWSAEGLRRRFRLFERVIAGLPLAPRARVLDLGCGAGTYVRYLGQLGHRTFGVDYTLPALARARVADSTAPGRYLAADGYELPFATGVFDAVICIGVMQALGEPERLFDEAARVLRPGGLFLVEGLNSVGAAAVARRIRESRGGGGRRVRCHSPAQVRGWLERRGLRLVQTIGVYLPPRGLPRLGWVLDRHIVVALLERIPGARLLTAHAFWAVAEKTRGRTVAESGGGR